MNGLPGCRRNRRHPVLTLAAGLWFAPVCPFLVGCGTPARDEDPVISQGKKLYEVSCGSCHRASGVGAEGVAAPLAGSPCVKGSEQRLVRIALHGVRGPIEAEVDVGTIHDVASRRCSGGRRPGACQVT
ncbi:cytochrome c [Acidobacteria bacterium AH-259-A15]|nr:cytochrome c [Acidobacteria bacterium AH-259-A15]